MSKEPMTEVVLNTRTKWGKRIWPEGKGDVPTASLDDLRDAGVLVEDEAPAPAPDRQDPAPQGGTQAGAQASASTDAPGADVLTDDQVEAVKAVIRALPASDMKGDGTPKVAAVNAGLKAANVELTVTAEQLTNLPKAEA